MIDYTPLEAWFITGSQHLYGEEALRQVAANAQAVVDGLNASGRLPIKVVYKPVVTRPEEVTATLAEAETSSNCVGLIAWMHTFSPAKMWIAGLRRLSLPLCHLHTQFGRDIPWPTIDMGFMNLHQSAHGGREFGHICTRLGVKRKVVVGHWEGAGVQDRVAAWQRAAAAVHDGRRLKVARIGDNMREVAVTEGDKVEAQAVFGYSVNGYGLGDLKGYLDAVQDAEVEQLVGRYDGLYELAEPLRRDGRQREALREAARIEVALRTFLVDGGFDAFTDTFENLHGLRQLPGIAAQRLMADGYGFGAEGDWKHAALVRAMKVMAHGLPGGTSFMEDYTYHLDPASPGVLGAHMLEICPSIAAAGRKPSCEVHPLGIGGKEDPVRLVFDSATGPAINVSVVDLGPRFRLLLNTLDVVAPEQPLPKLPVARALWRPHPDLTSAAAAWIYAGGAHHTGFSLALTAEHLEDYAEMLGIECVVIDADTSLRPFKRELKRGEAAWR